MSGRKPDVSVSIKPAKGDGKPVYLGAWWREEGRLRGAGWDKRVKRALFLVDDGRGGEQRIEVVRGEDGRMSHYLNAYENTGERQKAGGGGAPPPADDDWGDGSGGLPF